MTLKEMMELMYPDPEYLLAKKLLIEEWGQCIHCGKPTNNIITLFSPGNDEIKVFACYPCMTYAI